VLAGQVVQDPDPALLKKAQELAGRSGGSIEISNDPGVAARNADVLYTDVWTSMGQESEEARRKQAFQPFQLNDRLVSLAKSQAVILHCLPAKRGEEITDSVIEGKQSLVFDQAENRLHIQKAILISLMRSLSRKGVNAATFSGSDPTNPP